MISLIIEFNINDIVFDIVMVSFIIVFNTNDIVYDSYDIFNSSIQP